MSLDEKAEQEFRQREFEFDRKLYGNYAKAGIGLFLVGLATAPAYFVFGESNQFYKLIVLTISATLGGLGIGTLATTAIGLFVNYIRQR